MSHRVIENDLLFDFGDFWQPVIAWDKHPAYRHGIHDIDRGRAVDVLGLCGRTLFFIEVKDYRVHKRTKPIHPWLELESKVRNTVAGLLGACRRDEYVGECAPFVELIKNRAINLKIVFWYETPGVAGTSEPVADKRAKVGSLVAIRRAKNHLKWLNAGVFSTRKVEDYQEILPDLVVTNLPRRRRELAEAILTVLKDRRVEVPDSLRARIEGCLEVVEQERWLERATLVAFAHELFAKGR